MAQRNLDSSYHRAERERPWLGNAQGKRPEISLDEARRELSESLNQVVQSLFQERFGPLVGVFSETTINEILRSFEVNLMRTKGDLTFFVHEIYTRMVMSTDKKLY